MVRLASLPLILALGACDPADDGDDGDNTEGTSPPGALMVGMSRVRMPAPVGIGTAGYGPFGGDDDGSPFAEIYPATEHLHLHPDFRVVVVSRGEGHEAVFLRLDSVGVFQQFREGVLRRIEEKMGRDLHDALVIGATHTHSGPGRVIDIGGFADIIADKFLPEFNQRMIEGMATAVEEAYADLKPGRIGYAFADATGAMNDRRCEDGLDYTNATVPVVAIEQEGVLRGLMLGVAVHGTTLGIEDLTLSQDVSGAIERSIEARFDHPVHVQEFNAWGADMSPGDSATVPVQEGADQPDGFDRMARVGQHTADAVMDVLGGITFVDEPVVAMKSWSIPLDRETIGYESSEFKYDLGGVYCGSNTESDCDLETTFYPTFDDACLPFTDEVHPPFQTILSVGQLGELYVQTFPGEPGTRLAEGVMAAAAASGAQDVWFIGYAQDYCGYSILEDDWWQGGYEASGAMWGPKQGDYLSARAIAAMDRYLGKGESWEEPADLEPFTRTDEPFVPSTAKGFGTLLDSGVVGEGPAAVVHNTWAGASPWFGTPLGHLEAEDGTMVLRADGQPWDSDGLALWWDFGMVPTWDDDETAGEREYRWTLSFPLVPRTIGAGPSLAPGKYRFVVSFPRSATEAQEVEGPLFEVQ